MKKLGIAVAGILIALVATVWLTVTAVQVVGGWIRGIDVSAQAASVQGQIGAFEDVDLVGCWAGAQSLMNIETWLRRPVADNISNLKGACLKTSVDAKPRLEKGLTI